MSAPAGDPDRLARIAWEAGERWLLGQMLRHQAVPWEDAPEDSAAICRAETAAVEAAVRNDVADEDVELRRLCEQLRQGAKRVEDQWAIVAMDDLEDIDVWLADHPAPEDRLAGSRSREADR